MPQVDVAAGQSRSRAWSTATVTFTYDQLQAMPLFEQYVTIACVRNEVGGNLVGNAKWTGVHLEDVLAMAGVQPGATQIVGPLGGRLHGRASRRRGRWTRRASR